MKYTFKKSRRLAFLTDMEKNVSQDEAVPEIKEFCINASKMNVEDLSPMAFEKIENAIKINDRIHEVYGGEQLIEPELQEKLIEMKNEFKKMEEEVYSIYTNERYIDYLQKNNYTQYINEFKDDEFYLRDQLDEEEKGMLSEFTSEGMSLKNKFGRKISLKNKNKFGKFGFITDEEAMRGIETNNGDDIYIPEVELSEEEIRGAKLATNKQIAVDKIDNYNVKDKYRTSDKYVKSDYE